jgi:hypothetical protein
MTGMSIRSLGFSVNRVATWVRVIAVSFAILVLMGLSFVGGRATIGHTSQLKPVTTNPAVQPLAPLPAASPDYQCHIGGPC